MKKKKKHIVNRKVLRNDINIEEEENKNLFGATSTGI